MKFPRNAKIFQGRLDAAPFAAVLFLLAIFILLGSLLYTPGLRVGVELPGADDLPGTDRPTISVAVDRRGNFYFQNQQIGANELQARLRAAVKEMPELPTLVIHADRQVAYENLIRLTLLARRAGIRETWFATLPRVFPQ
jgi:biopolymer transport protein ExbD